VPLFDPAMTALLKRVMDRSVLLAVAAIMLPFISPAIAASQTHDQAAVTNVCNVVASPNEYSNSVITLEGILLPSEHSLALYGLSCKPREGFDVTMQAVLPGGWESLSNAKQLRKFLKRGKGAHVRLTGTFESAAGRYGPDAARFCFVVSEISSVEKPSGQLQ
jgi:hypothetical protein